MRGCVPRPASGSTGSRASGVSSLDPIWIPFSPSATPLKVPAWSPTGSSTSQSSINLADAVRRIRDLRRHQCVHVRGGQTTSASGSGPRILPLGPWTSVSVYLRRGVAGIDACLSSRRPEADARRGVVSHRRGEGRSLAVGGRGRVPRPAASRTIPYARRAGSLSLGELPAARVTDIKTFDRALAAVAGAIRWAKQDRSS